MTKHNAAFLEIPSNLTFESTMPTQRPLSSFSCLTFDCFGTLVDWEGGIYKALSALTSQLPAAHPLHNNRLGILGALVRHEHDVQTENPSALYSTVLAESYGRLAQELGLTATAEEKAKFGASVGEWPVFPDTVAALQRLKRHFKLVIISNVDRESFKRTLTNQFNGIEFDAIYTAQEIGSYKPDIRNFQYLIEHCGTDLGVKKEEIIHTAQSLFHDHVTAAQIGLVSAWIDRGQEIESVMGGDLKDFEGKVDLTWTFATLREMADAVDDAYSKLNK